MGKARSLMCEEPKKKLTALSEMETLMEEKLRQGGTVKFSPKGVSMLPMLRSRGDSVTLEKPPARLKKGTVALFISRNGEEKKYILHRLVGKKGDLYVFCGDNKSECDPPVGYEDIIGAVTEYESRGKSRSLKEPWYRLYSFWMVATRRIRPFSRRVQALVYRIWKKLFR